MNVREIYDYALLSANSTTTLFPGQGQFGAFLCTTAGSFELKDAHNNDILAVISMTAGQDKWLGISCPRGCQVVLSGGCAGTALFVGQQG